MEGILFQPPKKKTEQLKSSYLKWMQGEIELYYSCNVFQPIEENIGSDIKRRMTKYSTKPKISDSKKTKNLLDIPTLANTYPGSSAKHIYNKKELNDINELVEAEENYNTIRKLKNKNEIYADFDYDYADNLYKEGITSKPPRKTYRKDSDEKMNTKDIKIQINTKDLSNCSHIPFQSTKNITIASTKNINTIKSPRSPQNNISMNCGDFSWMHALTEAAVDTENYQLPYLYQPSSDPKNFYNIVVFHANAEDIFNCEAFCKELNQYFNFNVYCVEYPGYGLLKHQRVGADKTQITSHCFMSHLIDYNKVNPKSIIVIGKSIGTGFATYIASHINVRCLILISGFMSMKKVARDLVGGLMATLVKDILRSEDNIKKVRCPVLLIHGKEDKLISYKQSEGLYKLVKHKVKELKQHNIMTHDIAFLQAQIMQPIFNFLSKLKDNNL